MSQKLEYAFPIPDKRWADGMTLRDYFAAKAMQGSLSSSNEPNGGFADIGSLVRFSYMVANEMLMEREEAE